MFSLSFRIIDDPPNIATEQRGGDDVLGLLSMDFDGHHIGEHLEENSVDADEGDSLYLWFDLLLKVLELLEKYDYALQFYAGKGKGNIEYIREGDDLIVSLVRVKNSFDYAFDVSKARAIDLTYSDWKNVHINYHTFRETILHAVLDFGHRLELVRPEAVDTPETLKLIMTAEAMLDR